MCVKLIKKLFNSNVALIFDNGRSEIKMYDNFELISNLNLENTEVVEYTNRTQKFSEIFEIINVETRGIKHAVGGLNFNKNFYGIETTSIRTIFTKNNLIFCKDQVSALEKNIKPNPQYLLPLWVKEKNGINITRNFQVEIGEGRHFPYSPEYREILLFQIRNNFYNSNEKINFQEFDHIRVENTNKTTMFNNILKNLPPSDLKANFKEDWEFWKELEKQKKLTSLGLYVMRKDMFLENNNYNILTGSINNELGTNVQYTSTKTSNLNEEEFNEILKL